MHKSRTEIGSIIRQARKSKGLSREELAGDVGVHERTIADIERNTRSPRHDLLYKIVHALNLSPEQLYKSERAISTDLEWLNQALQLCDNQTRETFFRIARAFLDKSDDENGAIKKADE